MFAKGKPNLFGSVKIAVQVVYLLSIIIDMYIIAESELPANFKPESKIQWAILMMTAFDMVFALIGIYGAIRELKMIVMVVLASNSIQVLYAGGTGNLMLGLWSLVRALMTGIFLYLVDLKQQKGLDLKPQSTRATHLVYGLGSNYLGALGLGHNRAVKSAQIIPQLCYKTIRQFINGYDFVLSITNDHCVYGWGCNGWAQLAREVGVAKGYAKPDIIAALSRKNIREISCGFSHSLALTGDGCVYGWGYNRFGQVGSDQPISA
ncbi:unnamed protein product, partial [Medioppia subpectinata]